MSLFQEMKFMADNFVAKGDALGVFEFWLNRYQALIAALIALVAALLAAGLVWGQLAEARRQSLQARLERWRQRSVELDREVTLIYEITSGIDLFSRALFDYFDVQPATTAQPTKIATLQAAAQHMDAMIERFIRNIGPLWGGEAVQRARTTCRDDAQRFSVAAAEFVRSVSPGAPVVRAAGDALAEKLGPLKAQLFAAGNLIHAGIEHERQRAGKEIELLERKVFG